MGEWVGGLVYPVVGEWVGGRITLRNSFSPLVLQRNAIDRADILSSMYRGISGRDL